MTTMTTTNERTRELRCVLCGKRGEHDEALMTCERCGVPGHATCLVLRNGLALCNVCGSDHAVRPLEHPADMLELARARLLQVQALLLATGTKRMRDAAGNEMQELLAVVATAQNELRGVR